MAGAPVGQSGSGDGCSCVTMPPHHVKRTERMSRGPRGIREEPVPRSGQTHVQILVWELVVQGATLEEPLGLADLTCKWGYPAFSAPVPELLPVEATSLQGSGMTREDLAGVIESLGYDGFFNFEWDKDKGHSNEQFDKPSIGIFGDIKDKLEYLGVQPLKSLKSFKYDEIHQSDLNQLRHNLSKLAGISASEEVFNQKVDEFFAAYNKWFSTLTKADFTTMAKDMYKRMPKSELFENILKYNEVKNRKAKELGINVPRNI